MSQKDANEITNISQFKQYFFVITDICMYRMILYYTQFQKYVFLIDWERENDMRIWISKNIWQ